MKERIRRLLSLPWIFPVALFLLGFIAYEIQITHLGFYWDDWQAVFLHTIPQPQAIWSYFAYDRPFSAWTYALTFPVLGMNPVLWQLLSLAMRWAGVMCLYQVMKAIWPNQVVQLRWISALLLVFPTFTLQNVAVAFDQHFITFAFFALSLYLMVLAVKVQRWRGLFIGLSVFTCLVHIFTMEYFVGLEALRPVILWLLLRKPGEPLRKTAERVFKCWLPYLAALAAFAVWRFGIYAANFTEKGGGPNTLILLNEILKSPLEGLRTIVTHALQDAIYLLVFNWANLVQPDSIELNALATLFSWAVGLAVGVLFALYLRSRKANDEQPTPFRKQAFILGLVALFSGGLPVWLISRQIIDGKWSDRFALAPMLGAVILTVWAVDTLLRTQRQKAVFLALLLGLSVSAQIRASNKFRLDWDNQRSFYWQLYWRAPALEKDTAVISAQIPSGMLSDYQTAFALNTLYAGSGNSLQADTWFFTPRDVGYSIYAMEPGHSVDTQFRNVQFSGSTSDAIAFSYHPSSGCLLLLDAPYEQAPLLTPSEQDLLDVSNTSQILPTSGQTPDPQVFGSEPAPTWCYFFEKADLARQNRDWAGVINIMDQAKLEHVKPANPVEWLPLMEANAATGHWQEALETTKQANAMSPDVAPFLNSQWERFRVYPGGSAKDLAYDRVSQLLGSEVEASR